MSTRTFREACRENTGTHFLDSGGDHGRHWQQEAIPEDTPAVKLDVWQGNDRCEIYPIIETSAFLGEAFGIDEKLTAAFDEHESADGGHRSWFELAQDFMKEQEYYLKGQDNIYNGENDLSQVYIWEVWTDQEDEPDWIYPRGKARVIIFIHTGADVRGGYTRPYFCIPGKDDYVIPFDLCGGISISAARRNGCKLTHEECQEVDQEWEPGYCSHPASDFSKRVKRVFGFTQKPNSVVVLLDDGTIAEVYGYARVGGTILT